MVDNTSPLEGGSISLDDATTGLLTPAEPAPENPAVKAPVETKAPQAAPQAPEPSDEDETPEERAVESQETPEEAEEAAPAEEAETEEAEDEYLPPIDPPAHWKKDAREAFSQLSREHQQIIVDRERARDSKVDEALREAAEKRKAAEAELEAYSNHRQQYQQRLEQILPQLQQATAQEFADIKTVNDVQKMAQDDPERFAQWQARQYALQMAQAEHAQLQAERQMELEKVHRERLAKAEERLVESFPEWQDTERGRKEISEMHGYVRSVAAEIGADSDEVQTILAHMVEPWQFKIVQKAMRTDRAEAALLKARDKKVPKVQKPGTSKAKDQVAAEGRAAQLKRLEKTGEMEDALDLLLQ